MRNLNYKEWFFIILALCWISGVVYFILNYFIEIQGEFGLEKHPMQYPVLKIHGAMSFVIMIIFGYFLSAHVKKNLYSKNKRGLKSGIVLLSLPFICIITAYALYYLWSDFYRQISSYLHSFIGFILPFSLVLHIFQLTKVRRRKDIKHKLAVP